MTYNKQYFDKCHKDLKGTSYHTAHGISAETCARFNIGFDGSYNTFDRSTYPPTPTSWEALIIPTAGEAGHIAINTAENASTENSKRRTGSREPFNIDAISNAGRPVFVTDDIIDALSIIEAGGEAIALESAGQDQKQREAMLNSFKGRETAHPLILTLGHYAEAEELAEELGEKLDSLYIKHYTADLTGDFLTISNALQGAPEELKQAIAQAEALEDQHAQEEREAYLMQSAYNHIDEFLDGISTSADTPAISTGFKKLDTVLDGGLYEGLYICGAVTSLGKTTLIMQIADQIADTARDVLIFSLEMSRAELMSKSISRYTLLEVKETGGDMRNAKTARGITAGARYKNYSDKERAIINTAVNRYRDIAQHIFIHEGVGDMTTDYIRAVIKDHKRYTGNTPVVIVDYVQILAPHDYRATDKQNTDRNITELKRISRDFKTPVIGVSSFNRDNYGGAVNYRAFKESGAIEYGSDVLIGLQLQGADGKAFDSDKAIKKNPRAIELVILKNRQGQIGERVSFNYYPLFNYFEEISTAQEEPAPEVKRVI